ncbi:MAG: M6 family metalloprotease domain-containing protein, partial [Prevotellaceae bacterium]|nr:M6 family metalloprotease domain-containing protein [Prevotellaceae bacterium]
MIKNEILYLLFLIIFPVEMLFAVPATPNPVIITQPDGSTIEIRLRGDEFFHYRTSPDGYLLETDNEGYMAYAYADKNKNIVSSGIRASNIGSRSLKEKNYLETIEKNPDLTSIGKQKRLQRSVSTVENAIQQKAYPLNGSPKSLVILVNFTDRSFLINNPKEAFTNLLNEEGYSANLATGSARDYFIASSMGKFSPQFDVAGPYTLPNNRAYYGENDSQGNDKNPRQMIIDACNLADTDVNFKDYDTDGDGRVDNIFVFYAGHNEAEGANENTIWPHRWVVQSSPNYDGVRIYDYACTSELKSNIGSTMCGVGTFVHEFGHVLGLPDFYATNDATHHTLSYWSVMDTGPYLNEGRTPPAYSAYERFYLGWLNPVELKEKSDNILLDTLTTSNTACIITQNGNHNLNGKNPNPVEFFMIENRQQKAWDAFLPGHGMLVTRIYYSATDWNKNEVNNTSSAMGVDIIEADGVASSRSLPGDPFPGISETKIYRPKLRNGTNINKPLKEIEEADGIISFSFMKYLEAPTALAA